MAFQSINLSTGPDQPGADNLYSSFQKVNDNFSQLGSNTALLGASLIGVESATIGTETTVQGALEYVLAQATLSYSIDNLSDVDITGVQANDILYYNTQWVRSPLSSILTYEVLTTANLVGNGASQIAQGSHNHDAVYAPISLSTDVSILTATVGTNTTDISTLDGRVDTLETTVAALDFQIPGEYTPAGVLVYPTATPQTYTFDSVENVVTSATTTYNATNYTMTYIGQPPTAIQSTDGVTVWEQTLTYDVNGNLQTSSAWTAI